MKRNNSATPKPLTSPNANDNVGNGIKPQSKSKPQNSFGDRNYNSDLAKTIGKKHYDKARDILEKKRHTLRREKLSASMKTKLKSNC